MSRSESLPLLRLPTMASFNNRYKFLVLPFGVLIRNPINLRYFNIIIVFVLDLSQKVKRTGEERLRGGIGRGFI